MEPKVNRDMCISCGACVSIAPDVFELDDEGISVVIGKVDQFNKGNVIEATEACPTSAIEYDGYQDL